MRRAFVILITALSVCMLVLAGYMQITTQIRENQIEQEKRAQNQLAVTAFDADIAKVQHLIDKIPNDAEKPSADEKAAAQQCVQFAREWWVKAKVANSQDAFISKFELSTSRFWLKMALKHLERNDVKLSDWTD